MVLSHERPLHLILVSRGLADFQHVHPEPTGRPGEYAVNVAFPSGGDQMLFAEFQRANGATVLHRTVLTIDGPAPGALALPEDLAPKVVDGARVSLSGAEGLRAARDARLLFRLEDAATGRPLDNRAPYLGAPATWCSVRTAPTSPTSTGKWLDVTPRRPHRQVTRTARQPNAMAPRSPRTTPSIAQVRTSCGCRYRPTIAVCSPSPSSFGWTDLLHLSTRSRSHGLGNRRVRSRSTDTPRSARATAPLPIPP